eukprot:Rmarinus@m.17789
MATKADSGSIGAQKLNEILDLFREERVILAGKLLKEIESCDEALSNDAKSFMDQHEEEFATLRSRATKCIEAMNLFTLDEGWTFALEALGVTTHFKLAEDGTIWLKMQSLMRCPLFDLVAVVNETDQFHRWLPFCNDSRQLKQVGRAHQVVYHCLNMPFLARDAVLAAYGVDATDEGHLLIMGSSVDPVEYGIEDCPAQGTRMNYKALQILITPSARDLAKATMIINVDAKAPVPNWLLHLILKKVAGLVLYMMSKEANCVSEDGEESVYRQRVKEKSEFYDWLRRRFDEFFDQLDAAADEKEEKPISGRSEWVSDSAASDCMQCGAKFTFTRRKHHCRGCGKIFCASCSSKRLVLPNKEFSKRVCDNCYEKYRKKHVKKLAPEDSMPPAPRPKPRWRVWGRALLSYIYTTQFWPVLFLVPYFACASLRLPQYQWVPPYVEYPELFGVDGDGDGGGMDGADFGSIKGDILRELNLRGHYEYDADFSLGGLLAYRFLSSVVLVWMMLDSSQQRSAAGTRLMYTRVLAAGVMGILSFIVSVLLGVLSLLFDSPRCAWFVSFYITGTLVFVATVLPWSCALYSKRTTTSRT